jgi:hypothetical protein
MDRIGSLLVNGIRVRAAVLGAPIAVDSLFRPSSHSSMKLSAQLVLWLSLAFAVACIAYAGFGFSSIDVGTDPQVAADSRGYAWFWLFLGGIGVVMAGISWLMVKGRMGRDE